MFQAWWGIRFTSPLSSSHRQSSQRSRCCPLPEGNVTPWVSPPFDLSPPPHSAQLCTSAFVAKSLVFSFWNKLGISSSCSHHRIRHNAIQSISQPSPTEAVEKHTKEEVDNWSSVPNEGWVRLRKLPMGMSGLLSSRFRTRINSGFPSGCGKTAEAGRVQSDDHVLVFWYDQGWYFIPLLLAWISSLVSVSAIKHWVWRNEPEPWTHPCAIRYVFSSKQTTATKAHIRANRI